MAAIPMLRRNVKLEMLGTVICEAFVCQLHIPKLKRYPWRIDVVASFERNVTMSY